MLRARRMTAFELAHQTRIYDRTLSNYLAGRLLPSNKHLLAICEVLEVDPEVLVDGEYWRLEDPPASPMSA